MEILKTRGGKIAKSKIVAGYNNYFYIVETKRMNKEIRSQFSLFQAINDKESRLMQLGKFNYILHEETRLTNNKLTKLHNEAIKTGLIAF